MMADKKAKSRRLAGALAVKKAWQAPGVVATERARISKGPRRPFLLTDGDGEPRKATGHGRRRSPWYAFTMRDGVCLAPMMTLVTRHNDIVRETVRSSKALVGALRFAKHQPDVLKAIQDGGVISGKLPPTGRHVGDVFVLTSAPLAYFHWLLEALPNVGLWRDLGCPGRLMVPTLTARWQWDSLAFVGVREDELLQVEKHVAITGEITFAGRINPSEDKLASLILPFFRELGAAARNDGPGRIFVSRSRAKRRHLLNEAEVVDRLAAAFGFECVNAETLTFADQVRLFANAEIIVGTHGAGLANAVFAPPGAIVVELRERTLRPEGVSAFAALAGLFDQPYGLVLGPAAGEWREDHRARDFTVSADAVVRMIEVLLERSAEADAVAGGTHLMPPARSPAGATTSP